MSARTPDRFYHCADSAGLSVNREFIGSDKNSARVLLKAGSATKNNCLLCQPEFLLLPGQQSMKGFLMFVCVSDVITAMES